MKNFIFFDIDGTIISEDGYLPESAVRAIQAARKKGNATLINTGRTAMNVDPFLREIGFDGYIYGCGTELEYDGKVLFHEKQTPARSREMVELVRRTNVAVLYEAERRHIHRPQGENAAEPAKAAGALRKQAAAVRRCAGG
ncbi:MAG: HAD hydrolase family protein [Ruminococcus sp.]